MMSLSDTLRTFSNAERGYGEISAQRCITHRGCEYVTNFVQNENVLKFINYNLRSTWFRYKTISFAYDILQNGEPCHIYCLKFAIKHHLLSTFTIIMNSLEIDIANNYLNDLLLLAFNNRRIIYISILIDEFHSGMPVEFEDNLRLGFDTLGVGVSPSTLQYRTLKICHQCHPDRLTIPYVVDKLLPDDKLYDTDGNCILVSEYLNGGYINGIC